MRCQGCCVQQEHIFTQNYDSLNLPRVSVCTLSAGGDYCSCLLLFDR